MFFLAKIALGTRLCNIWFTGGIHINHNLTSYPFYGNPLVKIHANYTVLDNTYNNVAEIKLNKNDSTYWKIWIAKNNWIIKKEIYQTNDTIVWSLLRSRIVQ